MQNQVYTGTPTSRRQILCPTTVKAGDPILVGPLPAVALDDYQTNILGTTVMLGGTFNLSVIGRSANSPLVAATIKPGDRLYASAGTFDSVTNCTTGFVLDANSSGVQFGRLDPTMPNVLSGTTVTTGVEING